MFLTQACQPVEKRLHGSVWIEPETSCAVKDVHQLDGSTNFLSVNDSVIIEHVEDMTA